MNTRTSAPTRRLPSLDSLGQDLRYALRTLRTSPGFTAIAILTLALGIGANTAIFSLVSAVLLKPLPFVEPSRLVLLWEDFTAIKGPSRVEPAAATVVEWKRRTSSFEGIAMLATQPYNLTGDGEPERLQGVRTDTNLFSLLGLRPILGRTFVADDEGADAPPVVVLNERLWARRFGADPALIGRTIVLDGLAHTVIGVIPDDFRFPNTDTSLWVPASYSPAELANSDAYNYYAVARLRPAVDLGAAQAELDAVAVAMQSERPNGAGQSKFTVALLQEHLGRDVRPTFYMLAAAVATILLITCANVANLLLARGTQRNKELAVRKAIGAAGARVLRQLLTESAVLAAGGVLLGVALSTLAFAYLARLVPRSFPIGSGLAIDWRVLVFAIALSVFTVLLFGAGPALIASRRGFNDALRSSGATVARRSGRVRNGLVVAEITLTVVLLAAAGLLLRSYTAVLAVDPGFKADHLLLVETPLAPSKYGKLEERTDNYRRVLERVRASPGVLSAGYVNLPPLVFKGGRVYVSIEGEPPPSQADFARYIVADRVAGEGYLETLGVPLLQGRQFDSRDGPAAAPNIIISQSMAKRYWPDRDPIGQRIKIGGPQVDAPWLTVIGVVGDTHQMGLDIAPEPEFFLSAAQDVMRAPFFWPGYLLVRTQADPLALATTVRRAVWEIDANQPVASTRTMQNILDGDVASRNMQLTVVAAFATLALLLASVGLYGVLSYTIAQRTAEIGLRMALGAQAGNVVRGVVRAALRLASIGVVLGVAGAFGVTRLLGSFLFGVSPMDPTTLAGVAFVLVAVTVVASLLPALRAARVDPMTALRSD
jgi:putative ABC transport system permease protein